VICEVDGRQAEVAPELHAELLALLERE